MEVSEDDLDGFAGVADDVDAGAGGGGCRRYGLHL